MSIELMLLAVNLNFLVFSVSLDDMMGQLFALLVLTVAAAESAIGLAIFVITFHHLLLHCSFAQEIWNKVRKEFGLIAVFPGSWYEWLTIKWFFIGDKKKCKTLWRCSCMAVMWCIWREK